MIKALHSLVLAVMNIQAGIQAHYTLSSAQNNYALWKAVIICVTWFLKGSSCDKISLWGYMVWMAQNYSMLFLNISNCCENTRSPSVSLNSSIPGINSAAIYSNCAWQGARSLSNTSAPGMCPVMHGSPSLSSRPCRLCFHTRHAGRLLAPH